MPDYLAPGVYIEETGSRPQSIAGVETSTAAFVGLTASGPVSTGATALPLLTSLADFERFYGGLDDLHIGGAVTPNYVAHAVRAFFANGGRRLHVARVPGSGAATATAILDGPSLPQGAEAARIILRARTPSGATLSNRPYVNCSVHFVGTAYVTTKQAALQEPPGMLVQAAGALYVLGLDLILTTAADLEGWNALADDEPVTLLGLDVEVTEPWSVIDYVGLGFHPDHPCYIGSMLAGPLVLDIGTGIDAFALRDVLLGGAGERRVDLTGGTDGNGPPSAADVQAALDRILTIEDIAVVAAPGASAFAAPLPATVSRMLTEHAETRRAYRLAVLDPPPGLDIDGIRTFKSQIDSRDAALYYPWVRVADPLAAADPSRPAEIVLPPSGFVCGLYARSDSERGVSKAPANMVVRGALGLQREVLSAEQDILNPLGINCIRVFENRGIRLWGARTTSSDPEWKYVNVRRYSLYLQAAIDRGTRWAMLEANNEGLWAIIRRMVSEFLIIEWRQGALIGAKAEEAFFVRCDRSTMSQSDINQGLLVCDVGIALVKPAEFIILRITQKTADTPE
jgi:phage tail sheath protein FI